MRTLFKIFTVALLSCAASAQTTFRLQLKTHTVYIVPMANGMDRHLASRLTSTGTVWVLLDPAGADAVITDRVDEGFWAWSNAVFKPGHEGPVPRLTDDRLGGGGSTAAANRGTLFLVDPRNGVVLWSIYQPPANTSPNALDQAAARVATNLKKHLDAK